jgi:hypothetical protein
MMMFLKIILCGLIFTIVIICFLAFMSKDDEPNISKVIENLPETATKDLLEKAHKGVYKTVDDFLKESVLNTSKDETNVTKIKIKLAVWRVLFLFTYYFFILLKQKLNPLFSI